MLNIRGNEIMRGTERIGYIYKGNEIWGHAGQKLGYIDPENRIYNAQGLKVAHLDDVTHHVNYADGKSVSVDENRQHIQGGEVSDAHRAAIRLFLGE